MSKKDDINQLYDVSAALGKVNNILFFVNVILSFLSLFCETKAKEVFIIIQICLSALFVILTLISGNETIIKRVAHTSHPQILRRIKQRKDVSEKVIHLCYNKV